MNAADSLAITRFVRDTLGCQCPDDVFRSITLAAAGTPDDLVAYTRLAIGGRLLIYVVTPPDDGQIARLVQTLAVLGRAERDASGYNRFRLVLAAERPEAVVAGATQAFGEAAAQDNRAHLHVLPLDSLASLLPADARHRQERAGPADPP